MIIGIGTDITECDRIQRLLERDKQAFLNHLLTASEQAEIKNELTYTAGHWAAKEAIAKALGCGIGSQCSLNEIEILHDPSGCPVVSLHGAAAETARQRGGTRMLVSISHEQHYAVAFAVLEK